MNVAGFFKAVLTQDAKSLRQYFHKDARINWHCTNESFTVEEYILANCEYPGQWDGELERVERFENLVICAAKVYPLDRSASFHVVSFLKIEDGKIAAMDEYWADDGVPPQWRLDKQIGTSIQK